MITNVYTKKVKFVQFAYSN